MNRNLGPQFSWQDVERENAGFGHAGSMIHDAMREHFGDDYRDRLTFERGEHQVSESDAPDYQLKHHVENLAGIYRKKGPEGLPPLTYVEHPEHGMVQIDGGHRRAAARQAGLKSVPAYYGKPRG